MRSLQSILVVRSILAAFVAIVAVVSFVNGQALIGALFTAMTLTNVALIVTISRRRARSGSPLTPLQTPLQDSE